VYFVRVRASLSITDGPISFVYNVARFFANGPIGITPKDGDATTSIICDDDPLTAGRNMTRQRT
jgi:hypothetical protein